ncbi:MAG: uncharacterized protein QOG63_2620 [Thermoleophilaceae bacterium]|jgi:ketosteroid isomerase-like protein|nr:uncharacterized protein [Thermoleophilaceae bacterium]
MSTANLQLARDAYDAFGRGDIESVLGMLDENVAWHVPDVVPHGRTASGREEVAGFFQNLAATWDEFGPLEFDDISAAGDHVYAVGTAHGTYEGERTSYGFVHVWTVTDGACARFDEYVDPARALYADRSASAR